MLRGTLRMPGYCRSWNAFVKLGLTDDSFKITGSAKMTWRELIDSYLPKGHADTRLKMAEFLEEREDSEVMKNLDWLGIFDDKPVTVEDGTPAQVLQSLLEEKWKLKEHDKDMIVMQHQFEFIYPGQSDPVKLTSSLVVKGEDQIYTAMARTVGLPAAIGAKLILNDKIKARGVVIPTIAEIYEPLLNELEEMGMGFVEGME